MRIHSLIYTVLCLISVHSLSMAGDTTYKVPPMGWNSYDCFGSLVREGEVLENSRYMAKKLKAVGWNYVVIDIVWSKEDYTGQLGQSEWKAKHSSWSANMDTYGRLIPDDKRFPSSKNGKGFKALADSIHAMGLKFGIHVMRGIPRQAVTENTPILGTQYHASDIADKESVCPWSKDMWGLAMDKPGAQEYLNSCFKLYAEWEVDYIKIDDLIRIDRGDGKEYHGSELIAFRKAINNCGRKMFLSTSPGPASYPDRDEIAMYADAWRMSDDLWDQWQKDTALSLKPHFTEWEKWFPYIGPGRWPDNDMLPLGRLSKRGAINGTENRYTMFTKDEQYTVMTMTVMSRSPLMFGGNLPENDKFTDSLLMNPSVIAINQNSQNNRVVYSGNYPVWCANVPGSNDKYCAIFNKNDASAKVSVALGDLCLISSKAKALNLWTEKNEGEFTDSISMNINAHGCGLYRISPVGSSPIDDPIVITGTPFGLGPALTAGCEHTRAVDGKISTYYHHYSPNQGFTGIDFGPENIRNIAVIKYYPRSGWESKMKGGKFQGSNVSMTNGFTDLYSIAISPQAENWTSVTLTDAKPYRYVRYYGADGSHCSIAEMEFRSNDSVGIRQSLVTAPKEEAFTGIKVVSGCFSIPRKCINPAQSIAIYDLMGRFVQEIPLKASTDLRKDFGLRDNMYVVQLKTVR